MSIGTLRLACVAVLAVAATAAPASRPPVRARHVAPARSFRPYLPDRYVVVLKDPPVAERFPMRADAGSSAAAGYGREIAARQAAVASELASRHIAVTSQVSHLLNALFVSAPGHTIEELRAIPGVQSVTPMRRLRARLNRAEQLADASSAWNAVGGQSNAGKGIKIAILDSGIDLANPAFHEVVGELIALAREAIGRWRATLLGGRDRAVGSGSPGLRSSRKAVRSDGRSRAGPQAVRR